MFPFPVSLVTSGGLFSVCEPSGYAYSVTIEPITIEPITIEPVSTYETLARASRLSR